MRGPKSRGARPELPDSDLKLRTGSASASPCTSAPVARVSLHFRAGSARFAAGVQAILAADSGPLPNDPPTDLPRAPKRADTELVLRRRRALWAHTPHRARMQGFRSAGIDPDVTLVRPRSGRSQCASRRAISQERTTASGMGPYSGPCCNAESPHRWWRHIFEICGGAKSALRTTAGEHKQFTRALGSVV